ncbi:unnamed protein product [Didymodactylos carnosus]|uniref:G-protein coupled receptors family 1 profile domain-containing protein n=1 Tax=Didymodactylos carnosus TaxID=1234261 RepID=A0A8S2EIY0_9BILA|nr:unnamed protein product [Didymodactylos carnosus]CAF3971900.1 unnamed protein product [Didymodactylos carnosus]
MNIEYFEYYQLYSLIDNLNLPIYSKTKYPLSNAILFTINFHKFYPWFLLPFGIIGSLLTIIIFTRKKFKKFGCSVLFVAESVMDLILITLNCVRLIIRYTFTSHFLRRSLYICRTYKFMTNYFNHCAVWILCVISLERAAVTKRWNKKVFSKNHSYLILIIIFTILFILNGHYLLYFHIEQSDDNYNYTILKKEKYILCRSNLTQSAENYKLFYQHYLTWMDFILNSLIPFFIILIANLSLMYSVCMSRILMNKLNMRQTKAHKDTQLAYILFVSTFLFLLMTFPMRIFSIIEPYLKFDKDILILLDGIMRFLLYLDHGCGFYLYTFTGELFRKELRRFLLMFLLGRRHYNWSIESKRHSELSCSNGGTHQQHAQPTQQQQQHLFNNSVSSGGDARGEGWKQISARPLSPYGMKRNDFIVDHKDGLVISPDPMSKSHSREFFKKNKRSHSKKDGNNVTRNNKNNNHHLNNRELSSHNASTTGADGGTDSGHSKERKTKICCLL